MRLLTILLWGGLMLLMTGGFPEAAQPRDAIDLKQYQWKNRLLLIFSPAAETPAYRALKRELAQQAGEVRERQLLVFHVLEQGQSFLNGQQISPAGAESLRQGFGVAPGTFTVVLVGKDGGVKLKREARVALADIFGLIDSMPMRRQEMQGK